MGVDGVALHERAERLLRTTADRLVPRPRQAVNHISDTVVSLELVSWDFKASGDFICIAPRGKFLGKFEADPSRRDRRHVRNPALELWVASGVCQLQTAILDLRLEPTPRPILFLKDGEKFSIENIGTDELFVHLRNPQRPEATTLYPIVEQSPVGSQKSATV